MEFYHKLLQRLALFGCSFLLPSCQKGGKKDASNNILVTYF